MHGVKARIRVVFILACLILVATLLRKDLFPFVDAFFRPAVELPKISSLPPQTTGGPHQGGGSTGGTPVVLTRVGEPRNVPFDPSEVVQFGGHLPLTLDGVVSVGPLPVSLPEPPGFGAGPDLPSSDVEGLLPSLPVDLSTPLDSPSLTPGGPFVPTPGTGAGGGGVSNGTPGLGGFPSNLGPVLPAGDSGTDNPIDPGPNGPITPGRTVVPEPASLLLLATGFAGLAGRVLLKRRG